MFLPDCTHRMLILLNFAFKPTTHGIRKYIHPRDQTLVPPAVSAMSGEWLGEGTQTSEEKWAYGVLCCYLHTFITRLPLLIKRL